VRRNCFSEKARAAQGGVFQSAPHFLPVLESFCRFFAGRVFPDPLPSLFSLRLNDCVLSSSLTPVFFNTLLSCFAAFLGFQPISANPGGFLVPTRPARGVYQPPFSGCHAWPIWVLCFSFPLTQQPSRPKVPPLSMFCSLCDKLSPERLFPTKVPSLLVANFLCTLTVASLPPGVESLVKIILKPSLVFPPPTGRRFDTFLTIFFSLLKGLIDFTVACNFDSFSPYLGVLH